MKVTLSFHSNKNIALWLALLLFLFMLRVVGQLMVANGLTNWLPPMSEWASGLVPYPILLLIQLLILLVGFTICLRLYFKPFMQSYPRVGRFLKWFAALYCFVMIVRFGFFVYFTSEGTHLRGGLIPIIFHWVLAAFLFILGQYLLTAGEHVRKDI